MNDGRVNRYKPRIRWFNTSSSVRWAVVRTNIEEVCTQEGGGQMQLYLRNARLIIRTVLLTKRARKRVRLVSQLSTRM